MLFRGGTAEASSSYASVQWKIQAEHGWDPCCCPRACYTTIASNTRRSRQSHSCISIRIHVVVLVTIWHCVDQSVKTPRAFNVGSTTRIFLQISIADVFRNISSDRDLLHVQSANQALRLKFVCSTAVACALPESRTYDDRTFSIATV